ncbi:hypothetical protein [Aureispira anguillae]|uniref:Uncharacterized protein n=1 Tax=Aureispira anguillae TaxID=2864201 RepID=A0A915YBZ3_9BACT|nr:hypothetical protein [Aureispira anguillae]BDS10283.1 hypothetical protein AsAng_0009910 [Aureispira anguillae]
MKPIKVYHKDEHGHHKNDHKCGPKCNHEDHQHDDIADLKEFKKDKVRIIPEKKTNRVTFENFLNFFPMVELPYTITSDTQRLISQKCDPLSATWMFNFVLGKDDVIDEYTEFMPCFSIPGTKDFFAVVFWEAGIEGATYYLTTFSKNGILIDKSKIAGTKYDQDGLYQMVCTISPTWLFSCAEGRLDANGNTAPVSSDEHHLHTSLQLTGDGEIVPI